MDRLEHPAVFVVALPGWARDYIILVEALSYKEAEEKAHRAYPRTISTWAGQKDPVVFTDGLSQPYATYY